MSSCLSTSNKCLGKVVCQGIACPGVAGTMCFTLGNSDKNFKVCVGGAEEAAEGVACALPPLKKLTVNQRLTRGGVASHHHGFW